MVDVTPSVEGRAHDDVVVLPGDLGVEVKEVILPDVGKLPAYIGLARSNSRSVTDQPAGPNDQDRCKGRAPCPLHCPATGRGCRIP